MKRVLSVGQCGYDDSRISRVVAEVGGTVERAHNAADAAAKLKATPYDLVLVNRIFDSDGDSGIAFIGTLKDAGEKTPMMLISDYEEAQAQAVAEGALLGFGKSDLGTTDVYETLRDVLKTD